MKIKKIPAPMRQDDRNRGIYDPKVVSFGPYHHGIPELQTCEEVKHIALQMFVRGSNETTQFYYTKVLDEISYARSCYVDCSTDHYTDTQFAEMMLLDSCFLIYLINYMLMRTPPVFDSSIFTQLGALVHSLAYRDILLMENQIPFGILKLLINLRHNDGEESVYKLLHKLIWGQYRWEHEQIQNIKQQMQESLHQPVHLFEAVRWLLVCDSIPEIQSQERQAPNMTQHMQQNLRQPVHLFEAIRRLLVCDSIPESQSQERQVPNMTEDGEYLDLKRFEKTFRSVKDLKAKGIHFKRVPRKSVKDIKFNSFTFYGELQLPAWAIWSLSNVFFANMIAYELCHPVGEQVVISYVNFMKSLIYSPADVKELREKRILLTSLGDEDVVKLFKDLNTYDHTMEVPTHKVARQRIQQHYDSRTKTLMAQLIYTYCSSPWSVIAWLAAVSLLVLTFLQTFFTINPRK